MPLFALPKSAAAQRLKSRQGYVAQETILSGDEGLRALLSKVAALGLVRDDVHVADAATVEDAIRSPQAFSLS
ncbi:hypothetical protein IHN63_00190 [Deinococcus sp. 6YEL10]|uniref:hypothetical protein n=1 Tax=Deinococcus sp. 6YEL10 TaxID=2745870 RepID=UPI001E373EF1|nr:hypothetical protein [Deinococcus sp. 6YEL10]MCD0159717.1 hypothetical protein [Deinococcus sp. 6YEL10]